MTWPAPNAADMYDPQCAHAPHCRSHFEDVQRAYDRRHGITWRCPAWRDWGCPHTDAHIHEYEISEGKGWIRVVAEYGPQGMRVISETPVSKGARRRKPAATPPDPYADPRSGMPMTTETGC